METSVVNGDGERLESPNLRDFLRVKQEDNHPNNNSNNHLSRSTSGRNNLTLHAVLSDKRGHHNNDEPLERVQSNRTLLDIIREESGSGAYRDGRKSWRHFKDKLRLRRNGSGSSWTSSVHIPASDIPINDRSRRSFNQLNDPPEPTQPSVVRPSLERNTSRAIERAGARYEHSSSLAMRRWHREDDNDDDDESEDDMEEEEEERGGEEEGEQSGRTSLMSLLAETDRQMGIDGLGYMMEDEEEEEEEEVVVDNGGLGYNNCCVCMVRHKGAAFIPCGHTFCRLCSRELYAQRGNCPLCNNYILEILDIF